MTVVTLVKCIVIVIANEFAQFAELLLTGQSLEVEVDIDFTRRLIAQRLLDHADHAMYMASTYSKVILSILLYLFCGCLDLRHTVKCNH